MSPETLAVVLSVAFVVESAAAKPEEPAGIPGKEPRGDRGYSDPNTVEQKESFPPEEGRRAYSFPVLDQAAPEASLSWHS